MTRAKSKVHARVLATPEERQMQDHENAMAEAEKIVRDIGALPEHNRWWDFANVAYANLKNGIREANEKIAERLTKVMATPEDRAKIKDEAELALLLDSIGRDIEKCNQILDETAALHVGKSGDIKDPAEVVALMKINEMYNGAMVLYYSNVMSSLKDMLELMGEDPAVIAAAVSSMQSLMDQAESMTVDPSTDPNVITDVAIKEEKTYTPVDKL